MPRPTPLLLLTSVVFLSVAACADDEKAGSDVLAAQDAGTDVFVVPQDSGPPPPDGEIPPPVEGEGEGDPGEGEGEGPVGQPRPLVIECGSIPDRVVQPNRLRITATVRIPDGICGAHLQIYQQPARQGRPTLRVVALETLNAPEGDCGLRLETLELPFPMNGEDKLGEWTFEMLGKGPTIFRKTVRVDSTGAEPEPESDTCAGGKIGFVGECGIDIFCQVPTPTRKVGFLCNDEGLCEEASGPGRIEGELAVQLIGVEKSCQEATPNEVPEEQCFEATPDLPEGGFFDNPLEVAPATLVIDQDPENADAWAVGRVGFTGDSELARWSGATALQGDVVGITWLRDLATDNRVRSQGLGNCTHLYRLQIPSITRYGDRVSGDLEIVHLEVNCGRGCLSCALGGKLVNAED